MMKELYKDDNVETQDGRFLGTAYSIHHRQHNIDPSQQRHATYLKVWHKAKGTWLFIPTSSIENIDASTRCVRLSVDSATVLKQTWGRLPEFIANAEDIEIELAKRS